MGDNIFGANGRTCDDASGIGYIVTPSSQRLRFAPECAQDVTPEGIEDIVIYRVVPDAAIALASRQSKPRHQDSACAALE